MFLRPARIILISTIVYLLLNNFSQAQFWTQITTTGSSPITRYIHTAVYDTTNNRMTIFGGFYFNGSNIFLNDVWVLDSANGLGGTSSWTKLTTSSSPPTRAYHTAVFDNDNNRMTIFGGFYGPVLNDVWVLEHANGLGGTPAWTQLTTSGTTPGIRLGHSAVYDSANNRMTVFGGTDNSIYLNDIWVLINANGLGGTPAWTQITTTGSSPTTRAGHSAIYDSNNNRMIIFGGISDTLYLNDIWVLSNANGLGGTPSWTQLFPTGSAPTTRLGHSAVYDTILNRMIIFGGSANINVTNTLNDVWVLSHANGLGGTPAWTQFSPTGSTPANRFGHRTIYDTANNRMTIFGGVNSIGYLNDVWVLDNADTVSINDWTFYSTDLEISLKRK